MQTIRSRFLTIICGVSLTLSMVFGDIAVILVDHDETIIAARTLNGQAAHVYTILRFSRLRRSKPMEKKP